VQNGGVRPSRTFQVGAAAYLAVVAAISLLSLASPSAWYSVRALLLFPISVPLLVVDSVGAVLLFGPDPDGTLPAVYFVAAALVAAAGRLLLAWLVWAQWRGREPAPLQ
jgi:hypothetical protein